MVNKDHPYLPNQIIRKNQEILGLNNLNIFETQWKEAELAATVFFHSLSSFPWSPYFHSIAVKKHSFQIIYLYIYNHLVPKVFKVDCKRI